MAQDRAVIPASGSSSTGVAPAGKAGKTLTKADLIERVAEATGLTKKQAEEVVESIFGGIIGALRSGEKIELRGFGSFRLRQRGARIARNPKREGVSVSVPAKSVPYFRPGKLLKEQLNATTPADLAEASSPTRRT
jgi:integration host factor subunit beta